MKVADRLIRHHSLGGIANPLLRLWGTPAVPLHEVLKGRERLGSYLLWHRDRKPCGRVHKLALLEGIGLGGFPMDPTGLLDRLVEGEVSQGLPR